MNDYSIKWEGSEARFQYEDADVTLSVCRWQAAFLWVSIIQTTEDLPNTFFVELSDEAPTVEEAKAKAEASVPRLIKAMKVLLEATDVHSR